jgi:hypothetical protein
MPATVPLAEVGFSFLGTLGGGATNRYNLFSMHFAFIKNCSLNLPMVVQAKRK